MNAYRHTSLYSYFGLKHSLSKEYMKQNSIVLNCLIKYLVKK